MWNLHHGTDRAATLTVPLHDPGTGSRRQGAHSAAGRCVRASGADARLGTSGAAIASHGFLSRDVASLIRRNQVNAESLAGFLGTSLAATGNLVQAAVDTVPELFFLAASPKGLAHEAPIRVLLKLHKLGVLHLTGALESLHLRSEEVEPRPLLHIGLQGRQPLEDPLDLSRGALQNDIAGLDTDVEAVHRGHGGLDLLDKAALRHVLSLCVVREILLYATTAILQHSGPLCQSSDAPGRIFLCARHFRLEALE
mmetsp:Transcript_88666/g.230116  ORF Transcript_88666/g.230116 Transcript_88666/m.230116 type:complete len:254 (+) Transcript_88666:252-1013(+)